MTEDQYTNPVLQGMSKWGEMEGKKAGRLEIKN